MITGQKESINVVESIEFDLEVESNHRIEIKHYKLPNMLFTELNDYVEKLANETAKQLDKMLDFNNPSLLKDLEYYKYNRDMINDIIKACEDQDEIAYRTSTAKYRTYSDKINKDIEEA